MLKLARIAGIALLLSFALVGCSDPTGYFLSRSAYYKVTPTPRNLTAEQLAGLVQTQLVQANGVAVESVTVGAANDLVIRYTASPSETVNLVSTPEGQNVLMAVGRVIGGYYDLDYANIDAVTVVPVGNGQPGAAVTTKTVHIEAWYNRQIPDQAYMSVWTPAS